MNNQGLVAWMGVTQWQPLRIHLGRHAFRDTRFHRSSKYLFNHPFFFV